jgi:YHS domain-containing protein
MKRSLFLILVVLAACNRAPHVRKASSGPIVMQTIDTADMHRIVVDPPLTLTDAAPALKTKDPNNPSNPDGLPLDGRDEALRAALPFAPAIAMDPVGGSKISIRASTPTAEYKGRIFYFTNEENKRQFLANPDQYMKGSFSHL